MKIIKKQRIREGFLNIDLVTIQDENGNEFQREVVNRGDAVAALVYDTIKKKYILVKQFRPGSESEIIEVVAGTMDVEGESPENCIKREILEEIGYEVDELKYCGNAYASPGGSSENIHFYLAKVSKQIEKGGGTEDEGISIIEISEDEFTNFDYKDLKTCTLLLFSTLDNFFGKSKCNC